VPRARQHTVLAGLFHPNHNVFVSEQQWRSHMKSNGSFFTSRPSPFMTDMEDDTSITNESRLGFS
jgi:hypothetical protein